VYLANPRITPQKTDIRDLQENMGNLTLIARVEEKSESVIKDGKKTAYAIIADDTGSIKFNLQDFQIDQVNLGRTVKISGVFTEVNGSTLEVSSWKSIESEKSNDTMSPPH
jgi:ssDNA-binding replication factor A large subunit